uniref:Ubiquitin carboxyl-terminal hydrolase 39 n=1 Tax=Panagrellus redivivus TaxID=6233 RepID=A0A7E4VDM3_PANRE
MSRKRAHENGDQEENGDIEVKRERLDEAESPGELPDGRAIIKHEDVDDAEDDKPVWSLRKAQAEQPSRQCPFLGTIDRGVLDFDFEKLCSVSLSQINVYACMVCGKYFQGRGTSTHAFTHALDVDHRVFLNLSTLKFYCLPENYEIIDPSLEDIQYVLKPTYSKAHIKAIDLNTKLSIAFDDTKYYPGIVGLNNIKANDYANVVFHALSHVTPLRNYFLQEENYASLKRPPGDILGELPRRFGELMRKLWNPRAFKAHVSPHEMLQAVVQCSAKKFQIIQQSDANEFLVFLLNKLHEGLNGTRKANSSVIFKTFQGKMRVYSRKVLSVDTTDEARSTLLESEEFKEKVEEIPFLKLTMDLPSSPLYRDEQLNNIIPQVPLTTLLAQFNGVTEKEVKTYKANYLKRYELLKLPDYLIVTYTRFEKNRFFLEKNPTIVNFPINNVDLYDCIAPGARADHKYTTYDLHANIVHDGPPEGGIYRVQLAHAGTGKWFELENLHVKDILPQMITLGESYIQIWKLNKTKTRKERVDDVEDIDTTASEPAPAPVLPKP